MNIEKTIKHLTVIKKSDKILKKENEFKRNNNDAVSFYDVEELAQVKKFLWNGNENRNVKDVVADYANYLANSDLEFSAEDIRKMSLKLAKDFIEIHTFEADRKSAVFLEELLANPENYYILLVTEKTHNEDENFEIALKNLKEKFPIISYLDYNFVTGEQIVYISTKETVKLEKKAKKLKEELEKSLGEKFNELMLLVKVDTPFSRAKEALGLTITIDQYELLKLA